MNYQMCVYILGGHPVYLKELKKRQIVYYIYAIFIISVAPLFSPRIISLLSVEFPLAIPLEQVYQKQEF